jgi:signal transduction histidine kinase
MQRSVPMLAVAVAIFLGGLVVVLVGSSIHATRSFIDESARVATRDQALHELERLLGHLEDAEDAGRGYLLTSQPEYLAGFHRALESCSERYGRLLALTTTNRAEAEAAIALRPLIDARLDHLRRGIEAVERDPQQTRDPAQAADGQALMDRLRARIAQLHVDESAALARDDADVRRLAALSERLGWGGGALALATIAASIVALRQQWRAREEADRAVRAANERLEQQVDERTSELAQANERLRQQARELGQANEELEAFSSTVSHDLRAPLRVVEGLARLVRKRAGAEVAGRVGEDLAMLESNTRKMRTLVDDLLSFSRLGRSAVQRATVDLRALVGECWSALALERSGRRVELEVGDLPPCSGDLALLRQVLMNLLANAIKYTRPRETARVEVGGTVDGQHVHCWVRDNGVGFDMGEAPRLFNVFSRLHGDDQFEGTGTGLAIVRRIVERHGGRVWAESAVDRGAVIHFTVPRAAEEPEARS